MTPDELAAAVRDEAERNGIPIDALVRALYAPDTLDVVCAKLLRVHKEEPQMWADLVTQAIRDAADAGYGRYTYRARLPEARVSLEDRPIGASIPYDPPSPELVIAGANASASACGAAHALLVRRVLR